MVRWLILFLLPAACLAVPPDHQYTATWVDDNPPGTSYRLYSIDAAGNRNLIADTPQKTHVIGTLTEPVTLIVEPYNACCVGTDSLPAYVPAGVRAIVVLQ